MALTEFQRSICRLVARQRIERGISYVAGGVALNVLLDTPRISNDIDIFHDAETAVHVSFDADRELLQSDGYAVTVTRALPGFVEALVRRADGEIRMEWARDSAFRFFPLVEHDELGLTLHPFDLATNKVLAMVGRLEVRDWIDVISSHERLQPFGYLIWAACSKDLGFSPGSLLMHARRTTHYSAPELTQLQFLGDPPDIEELGTRWRGILEQATELIDVLPPEESGKCVLDGDFHLFTADVSGLKRAIANGSLRFHAGSLGGAYPQIVGDER